MKRVAIPNRLQGAAIDEISVQSTLFGVPPCIIWRLWLHTDDWKHGTYLELHPDGMIERVTEREEEGPDVMRIKPANT